MSLTLAARPADTAAAPAAWSPARALRRHGFALILALALAVRLALLATPRSYFPDEIFQYLEPAHRLAFGTGIVPWEYRYGIRSWLVPLLLTGPMRLGDWLAPGTGAYLGCAKVFVVLLSLPSLWAAKVLGDRLSPRHGLFAAFALAIWCEAALFGTQALTEAMAVPLVLGGAALLPERERRAGRIALAGALLAAAIVVRFQYGPAVAVLGAMLCGRDPRRWALAALGGLAVLVAAGGLDMAMGQRPFGWVIENFHQNIGKGRSHAWTDGPTFYPLMLLLSFGVTLAPMAMLAQRVGRQHAALVACALVNIAAHTLIAHKEYRYILLSTTILVLLAAIGTAEVLGGVRRHRARWTAAAAAGWIAASLLVGATGFQARYWQRVTPQLEAGAYLRAAPKLCGLALVGTYWADTGGYAYLHRAVPTYAPDGDAMTPDRWVPQSQASFDTVLAPAAMRGAVPAAYRRTACFGDGAACVFQRPGGCDPAAGRAHEVNRMLVRIDR